MTTYRLIDSSPDLWWPVLYDGPHAPSIKFFIDHEYNPDTFTLTITTPEGTQTLSGPDLLAWAQHDDQER
jgi:hypothetical protein